MITILLGEQETPWYATCRRFETAEDAYAAFVAVHEASPGGEFNIGIYRHQRVGLDKAPVLVSAVGIKREGVEAADAIMDDGEVTELHGSTWLELIRRRAEIVLDLRAIGATHGRYRILHDEPGEALC